MAGPIRISILANASQARRELNGVANDTKGFGAKLAGFGKKAGLAVGAGMALAGAAAVKFGKDAVQAASDAQQSLGATETVFGKYADTVIKNSKRASTALGISANEYRELSNVTGALLNGAGVPMKRLTGLTDDLNRRAADMAATFGGTTKEAVEAISSLLKGAGDPVERYGVSIRQADVSARLAAKGQDKLTGAAKKAAEMQARVDLLMQHTSKTSGAFAKESNTLAHQQQVLGAKWEDLKAKVGTKLLPVMTRLTAWLADKGIPLAEEWGEKITKLWGKIQPLIDAVKDWFKSFSGGNQANKQLTKVKDTFEGVWNDIKDIFTSAVSIITSLWNTFGSTMLNSLKATWTNIQSVLSGAFQLIRGIFQVFAGLLKGDWSLVWDGIKGILGGALSIIRGLVGQLWNYIKTAFSAAGAVLRGIWGKLWDGIKKVASGAWNWIVSKVKGFGSSVKGAMSSAWNAVKSATASIWQGIVNAVTGKIGALMGKIRGIKGKVTGAFSNAINWLKDAGKKIIGGLIDGVTSKIGEFTGKLKSLTSKIPKLKGPPKKDAKLLYGAGELIMQGLIDGVDASMPKVVKTFKGVTKKIAGFDASMQGGLVIDARTAFGSSGSGSAPVGATYAITVNAPVGASSADIGRDLVKHLDAYERAGGRRRA